jgi:hypothetical protein
VVKKLSRAFTLIVLTLVVGLLAVATTPSARGNIPAEQGDIVCWYKYEWGKGPHFGSFIDYLPPSWTHKSGWMVRLPDWARYGDGWFTGFRVTTNGTPQDSGDDWITWEHFWYSDGIWHYFVNDRDVHRYTGIEVSGVQDQRYSMVQYARSYC